MIISLKKGTRAAILGAAGAFHSACKTALLDAGARVLSPQEGEKCDIFVAILPLIPDARDNQDLDFQSMLDRTNLVAQSMNSRDGGRIVLVLSALGAVPMRGNRQLSQEMASAYAGTRVMAMDFGPKVLVNAVGLGVIEAPDFLLGDRAQLSHVPLARSGTFSEAIAGLLFFCDPSNTYTSGQLLCVDGGWTAGYARDF